MNTTVDKIISLLEQKKLTQNQLAEYLGLRSNCVSEWKVGKTQSYKKHLEKIAEFLEVPIEFLLGSEQNIECPCPDSTVSQLIAAYNDLSLSDKARALTYVCSLKEGTV